MFEDKACKCSYEDGNAQFDAVMKVTTVKENRRINQCGPTEFNQPREIETTRPTRKEENVHSKSTFI
jgi:hypothetical protein